jgi:hypothetical protein
LNLRATPNPPAGGLRQLAHHMPHTACRMPLKHIQRLFLYLLEFILHHYDLFLD